MLEKMDENMNWSSA